MSSRERGAIRASQARAVPRTCHALHCCRAANGQLRQARYAGSSARAAHVVCCEQELAQLRRLRVRCVATLANKLSARLRAQVRLRGRLVVAQTHASHARQHQVLGCASCVASAAACRRTRHVADAPVSAPTPPRPTTSTDACRSSACASSPSACAWRENASREGSMTDDTRGARRAVPRSRSQVSSAGGQAPGRFLASLQALRTRDEAQAAVGKGF